MFSFQTLLKGTSSLLTCHLQFSITARVSMTLKRQSVQRLSDHKTVRTFCVNQEYGKVERMVWSKTNGRSLLYGAEKGWGEGGEWVRLGREPKIRFKKYYRNWQWKNKRKKTRKKKIRPLRRLIKSSWKVSTNRQILTPICGYGKETFDHWHISIGRCTCI